mgnify:CR=1 FL=1
MAARQFTRRARGARTRIARSVPIPARTRAPGPNARFLHVPASAGSAKAIEGREAAMTLLQAAHVVAHAVLRGAFSIRWISASRPSGRKPAGR